MIIIMRLGIFIIILILAFAITYSANMPLSAYASANLLANLLDPVMIVIIILWSIVASFVSNLYVRQFVKGKIITFELLNVGLFLIAALIIAVLFNKVFIDPFRLRIGAEPSPILVRTFSVFVISYLINGIIGVFKK